VLGCGSWGTAFSRHMVAAGHDTTLVCRDAEQAEAIGVRHRNPRYLFDVELPEALEATTLERAELEGAELVALAVPSRAFVATVAELEGRLSPDAVLLSLTKGLDPATGRRLSEALVELAAPDRVAVLSGPNHAEEVVRDVPTASVIASADMELARRLQCAISTSRLRI
jgi:glycerol-3-phosphate dehydrogenase (NAD(P)+)